MAIGLTQQLALESKREGTVKTVSGKKVIRNLFSGKPVSEVPMLLPIITLGTKILQVPEISILKDPSAIVQGALQIQQLFKPHGMVIYDPSLETEALSGISERSVFTGQDIMQLGRIATAMETTKRLHSTLGKGTAVFPALPGPVELACRLSSADSINEKHALEDLSTFLVALAREYFESQVDGLIVVENSFNFSDEVLVNAYDSFLATLGNMAQYYNVPLILYLQGELNVLNFVKRPKAPSVNGFMLDAQIKSGYLRESSELGKNKTTGLIIPEDLLFQTSSSSLDGYLKEVIENFKDGRFMLSVPWRMSENLKIDDLLNLFTAIKQAG